ncbi:PREDICTED: uncharacterized protein LOC108978778 [Bactrocera latifrons]|uniref:Uncharacterized protein n=1 Tax=Bactrocera latifrons TaxID=174628 RepID=A0A0K8VRD9_BACLA|nr:PREDICTED: uncharacterized protein LOC108978778 [Bactrocera latifrons]
MYFGRRNTKSLVIASAVLLVLYVLCANRPRKFEIDTMIYNVKPVEVWEYMSDFSKIRTLNPSVLSFNIIGDSGHAHDWRYTVEYWERTSHWPHFFSKATADYIVKKTMPGEKDPTYTIESRHTTCFFKGIYCMISTSEFKCRAKGRDTYCEEDIVYQCPPFLGTICRRELENQRKTVMENLTAIFSNSG